MGDLNPFSTGNILQDLYDPAGLSTGTGLAGGDTPLGDFGQLLADPMDLAGHQAEQAQTAITDILTKSAQEGIAQQEEQEAFLRERYDPYYQGAVGEGGALGGIQAMAGLGGDVDYTPSRLYEYQKRKGLEGIKTSMAKSGLLHSSAREQRTAEFMGDLSAEEAERAYGGQLSRLQLGTGAAEAVGAAGRSVSGQIGGLYSGLASGLNVTTQAYGQARESSFGSAGNTLGNLAAYQMQQG